MTKYLATTAVALSLAFSIPAYAQHYHGGGGYHGGYYGGYRGGRGWVGPALGGAIVGGVLGGALAAPYYYSQPAYPYYAPSYQPSYHWDCGAYGCQWVWR